MKKPIKLLAKIAPALTSCLAFVLTISANTSTSYIWNQPAPPKGLDDFKHIK